MNHCPVCGRPAPGLCSVCRGQIVSLAPGDPRYIWYMRAVRAAYFGQMNRLTARRS